MRGGALVVRAGGRRVRKGPSIAGCVVGGGASAASRHDVLVSKFLKESRHEAATVFRRRRLRNIFSKESQHEAATRDDATTTPR